MTCLKDLERTGNEARLQQATAVYKKPQIKSKVSLQCVAKYFNHPRQSRKNHLEKMTKKRKIVASKRGEHRTSQSRKEFSDDSEASPSELLVLVDGIEVEI